MPSLIVRHGTASAPDDALAAAWSGAGPAAPLGPATVAERWPGSLLLVVERGGVFAGRCVLSPAAERFRLRPPALADLSEAEGIDVAAAMASRARELVPAGRQIEAFPADDVRHDAVWRAGMAAAGYREVASTRVWERAPAEAPVRPPRRGLRPAAEIPLSELEELVADVRSSTADRVDTGGDDPPGEILARLAADPVASPVPDYWLVAVDEAGAGVVGYVLGSEDDDGDVWVMDLGVRPDRRGQGLGRELLEALVSRAAADERNWVRAQVDTVNTPSELTHRAAGFSVDGTTYRTWHSTGLDADAGGPGSRRGASAAGVGHGDADA